MERSEAEAIYEQGREPVIEVLLALSARLEAQDAQLAALAERVEELERRLKRDSSNSSLPPSHDPPWLGKRGRSRGTGRKAGAQPGRVGHGWSLFPMERVTEVVDHWPACCACGHVLDVEEREPAGVPARDQVAELPPLAVELSEHRLQCVCCPECGGTVRAELPAGVSRGCFGPKLEAAIASLTVRNRLSRRQLVELMEELFGCPIAVGTIEAILSRTAEHSSRSTRSYSSRRVPRARSTWTRPAGTWAANRARSGAPSANRRRSCGSHPTAASSTYTA